MRICMSTSLWRITWCSTSARAEGLALARPGQRLVVADLREAERAPADISSRSPLKLLHDRCESRRSPRRSGERAGTRHAVEAQLRGVAAPPAHLGERRARRGRARRRARRAARCRPRPWLAGAHRDRDPVGAHARGDEDLLAVDDPVVAVAPRAAVRRRGDVGAAARLGDRERGDLLAGAARRERRAAAARRCRAATIGGRPMLCENRLAIRPPLPARATSSVATRRSAHRRRRAAVVLGIAEAEQARRSAACA